MEKEEWIVVKGSCSIRPMKGAVKINCMSLRSQIHIPNGMVGLIEALEPSELEVSINEHSFLEKRKEAVPKEWFSAMDEIKDAEKIMVIGALDSGKSTFILFSSNYLIENNVRVAIVDADVGQSDIGPPTLISVGIPSSQVLFLSDIPPLSSYFVGDTSPRGNLLPMVVGTKKMVDKAFEHGAKIVLINTTGMVFGGPALALKLFKLEAVSPDIVVGIGEEVKRLIDLFSSTTRVIHLPKPRGMLIKNRLQRISRRKTLFSKAFKKLNHTTVDIRDVKLIGDLQIVEALSNPSIFKAFVDIKKIEYLLVGLHNRRLELLDIGLLLGVDPDNYQLKLLANTNVVDQTRIIKLGRLRVMPDGTELGRVNPQSVFSINKASLPQP